MYREAFDRMIGELDRKIVAMGASVREALQKAILAFREGNWESAKAVKKADHLIDLQQTEIEDLVATAMATQQPVAKDLRLLLCAIHMAGELERSADYAAHLAKATKFFAGTPAWRQTVTIEEMSHINAEMISRTIEAFSLRSSEKARLAAEMDDQIDHLHKRLLKEMVIAMAEKPEEADRILKFIQVSGYMERLGDHMTNACEAVIYMVEGIHPDLNP